MATNAGSQWQQLLSEGWTDSSRVKAGLPIGGDYTAPQVKEAESRLATMEAALPFQRASVVSIKAVMASGMPWYTAQRWARHAQESLSVSLRSGRRPSRMCLKRLCTVASHATWNWTDRESRCSFLRDATILRVPCEYWALSRILRRACAMQDPDYVDAALRYSLIEPRWPTVLRSQIPAEQLVAALGRLPGDAVVVRPEGTFAEMLNGFETRGADLVEAVANLLQSRLGLEVEKEKATCLEWIANCRIHRRSACTVFRPADLFIRNVPEPMP